MTDSLPVSGASLIGMRRLYHQRITHPPFQDAGAVVRWLGAMQGQDYAGTKWAFGLRLPGSTDAQIEQAIADQQIMRTWALRGTLHYVAPEDIHWMVGLIAPRQIANNALRYRQLELDAATLERANDLIGAALSSGDQLTRSQLFAVLQANGIAPTGQRGFYMLQRAGLERLIFQGAMQGSETTFRALPAGTTLPKEDALAELARRYFISHGPTTLENFTQWSGLLIGEARTALASIQPELVMDTFDGVTYWQSPETPPTPERTVYLLPGFDEFVLGYKNRGVILDARYANAICPGGNGMFMPTIVQDGRIVGTWKRTIKKKAVEIRVESFAPLDTDAWDALTAAAVQFGAFLGLPALLQQ